MKARDLLLVLVGSRGAILRIALAPRSIWIGLILVLAASLARNYDGKFLLLEPRALSHGLVASVGNAVLLWGLFWTISTWRTFEGAPPFGRGFRVFLALFWMTAPLAFLYGIPFERFLTEPGAIEANLWILGLVATWRVLLITRVFGVLLGLSPVHVFFLVMLLADVEVFIAASLMEAPLIDFMGGLQHTEADSMRAGVKFAAQFWSLITFPVWAIGVIVALVKLRRGRWALDGAEAATVSPSAWAASAAALLMWAPGLALFQPEQARRYRAETLLRSRDVRAAFAEMSRHERSDYPPVWDPPPRIGYNDEVPTVAAIEDALALDNAPWVEEIYAGKLARLEQREKFWQPDDEPSVTVPPPPPPGPP